MRFAAATDIGRRASQQDDYIAVVDIIPDVSVFAVLDGHGSDGAKCSGFVKRVFCELFQDKEDELKRDAKSTLVSIFEELQALIADTASIDSYMSGTTASVLVIFSNTSRVLVANVGDSRVIVAKVKQVGGGFFPFQITEDHTLQNKSEYERVLNSGARIEKLTASEEDGPLRIFKGSLPYPGLVVTRTIGDTVADKLGVLATPEIFEFDLLPSDAFFVLGTDGLFDGLEIIDVVNTVVKYGEASGGSVDKAADMLIKRALKGLDSKNLDDNITAILVYPH